MQDSCRHNHLTEPQDVLGEPQSNTNSSATVHRAHPGTPAKGCQLTYSEGHHSLLWIQSHGRVLCNFHVIHNVSEACSQVL